MIAWLAEPNARWVFTGCLMLGASSGILSSFAMLRRRSLMGDALAHAALPGICAAFLLSGGKHSLPVLMAGALAAGVLGALCIQAITRYSRIKEDTALGLVLSVFFAIGIVLLTLIVHSGAAQAGLNRFLFGQAASLVGRDVQIMTICAAALTFLTVLLYKELKLLCFDAGYATSLGYPAQWLDAMLNFLIVLVVVIGLQAVGVILMVAMLITPAAAARFWTNRLHIMVILSAVIGALSGGIGTWLSTLTTGLPTGPLIVLSATLLFVVSLVFAPERGLAARAWRVVRLRKTVARENLLRSLYEWRERRGDWSAPFSTDEAASLRQTKPHVVANLLRQLRSEGLVARTDRRFRLTAKGREEAYRVTRNHRLWEMFLMHEHDFSYEQVDRNADRIEHYLTPDSLAELEELMRLHGRDPIRPPSPHPISI